MQNITLTVEDADAYIDEENVSAAVAHALKASTKWLSAESVKRLGVKLRIRSSAGRRRVRKGKIKGSNGSVWFGLRPLNVAYIRDYTQTKTGVISGGERFYKGAFVASINGSPETIFRRTRPRSKVNRPRAKPLPKGQRRKRKSPPIEVVREEFSPDMLTIITDIEFELNGIFKEAFFDYLDSLHQ